MPAIVAIVLGVFLGYACGGRPRNLLDLDSTGLLPVVVLFAIQDLSRGRVFWSESTRVGLLAWTSVSICLAAFVWHFSQRTDGRAFGSLGFPLFAIGTLGNVLVVLLNQAMPVAKLPGTAERIAAAGGFYGNLNGATLVPWLGDILAFNWGSGATLLSVGDVLLSVGVLLVLVESMIDRGVVCDGSRV
ncbi:MAG: hypothetical protein CVT67_01150 [Actinobacteria bacterium HGW-Actinobacteria-7]|nr:MAG: hypothetical protein CVT67_01150 [Actinobacteria bacterium HGW-Actinobacteria-7]